MSISTRFIVIIVIFIAALVLGFFFAWPKYQDFRQIQNGLVQKKTELSSKTDYYSQFKKTWNELEKYQDALSMADTALPQSYSMPSLFDYFQKTSGESGLVLEDLRFQGVAGEKIKEISFSLKVSGSYASFKSFLSALDNSLKIFKVKNIRFSSPEEGESFSFDLEVSTYSY